MPTPDSVQQTIVAAATRVMVRRGSAGARMREIAREARVSTAALYYHFEDKERLADAVFESVVCRVAERFLNAWNPGECLETNVGRAIQVCVSELADNPRIATYILTESHRNPDRFERIRPELSRRLSYRREKLHRLLRSQLDGGLREDASGPPPEDLLIDLVGLCAFPFLALPVLHALLGVNGEGIEQLLDGRPQNVQAFLLNGLHCAGSW